MTKVATHLLVALELKSGHLSYDLVHIRMCMATRGHQVSRSGELDFPCKFRPVEAVIEAVTEENAFHLSVTSGSQHIDFRSNS